MPDLAQVMGAMGRGTDSQAAHVTPGEFVVPKEILDNQPALMSAIIKAFQGFSENVRPVNWRDFMVGESNTSKNPVTGAEEFALGGAPGAGSARAGVDVDRDLGFGDRSGGAGYAPGAGSARALGSTSMGNVGTVGTTSGAPGLGSSRSTGATPGSSLGAASPGADNQGFFDSLLPDPTSQTFAPGIMSSMVPGAGTFFEGMAGLRQLAEENGWDVRDASQGAFNAIDAARGDPGERDRARLMAQFTPAQQETITESMARPTAMDPPGHLGLSGAMSPLQQRAAIATGATQGSSVFRSPEASTYYKNLLQRALIGSGGEMGDYGQVLPIESQYLKSVLGLNYSPTTQSLLEAIASA